MNNRSENHENSTPVILTTATMSDQDFAQWGVDLAAYVKIVDVVDDNGARTGETAWSIHAANGQHMGFAPSRDLAMAAIIREEMEPVSVH